MISVCCVLLIAGGVALADDPGEEALKILAKGWSGHGSTCVLSDKGGKRVAEVADQFLVCESKPYFFIAGVELSSDFQSLWTGPLAEGLLKAKDGKSIRWSIESSDIKTAKVKIGDKKYNLKDGCVFWVFRRGEKWEVYQTKVDPKLLKEESESQISGASFRLLAAVAKDEKALAEYAKSINVKVK
jgi:hypothetical protein